MKDWGLIILAAGKGTRLGGKVPKPLRFLGGKPLIAPILEKSLRLSLGQIVIVVSSFTKELQSVFTNPTFSWVMEEPKGTGFCALAGARALQTKNFIIVHADDSYFLPIKVLQNSVTVQEKTKSDLVVGYFCSQKSHPFGIIETGEIETKEQSVTKYYSPESKPPHHSSHKLLAGLYAGRTEWLLAVLPRVDIDKNGEIPLPDIIKIGLEESSNIMAVEVPAGAWFGINTPEDLNEAEDHLKYLQSKSENENS